MRPVGRWPRPGTTRAVNGSSLVSRPRRRPGSGRRPGGDRPRSTRRPPPCSAGGSARRRPRRARPWPRASITAACHELSPQCDTDRSAAARKRWASSRSPTRAQAVAAGTASITVQNQHWSGSPRVLSARSTMIRADCGSGAEAIIVPKMRCSRCMPMVDQRASSSASSSSRSGLVASTLGQAHLGEPLHAVGLAAGRVDVRVAGRRPRRARAPRGSRSPIISAASPIRAVANATPRRAPAVRARCRSCSASAMISA